MTVFRRPEAQLKHRELTDATVPGYGPDTVKPLFEIISSLRRLFGSLGVKPLGVASLFAAEIAASTPCPRGLPEP